MIEKVDPKTAVALVKEGVVNPFKYLKRTNELLSSPIDKMIGREYVIRALNEYKYFESCSSILETWISDSAPTIATWAAVRPSCAALQVGLLSFGSGIHNPSTCSQH